METDGRIERSRYPLRTMEVQDYFYVDLPEDPAECARVKNAVRAASIQFGKRHGQRFKSKTVVDEAGKVKLEIRRTI
jgi:hypothetical protein